MKDYNIEKYDFAAFEKENLPFTMIPTKVIQNTPASKTKASFLWIYLQSLPSTWGINRHHLVKHFEVSMRTLDTWLAWLNEVELIKYKRDRRENGQLGKVTLVVLNGSKFELNNHSAKICGVEVNHSAKKPQCGEATGVANCAHIKETFITDTRLKDNLIKNSKDLKNACASDEKISEKPSEPPALPVENVIKLPTTKKLENEVAIDPNYSYPETYFKQEEPRANNVVALISKDEDPVISYALSLSVEQQKKELDIPISLEQSLTIAQKQVKNCEEISIKDIVNALCWWMMYPVKQNYRKWLASWFAEGCYKQHKELVIKLGEQLEKDQRMKDGYVPNPVNYILDARYEDKIYQQPKPKRAINHNDTSWADSSRRSIFETI